MQLVQAQMDRVRFSVSRRSPRLMALVTLAAAGTALASGALCAAWLWTAWPGAAPTLLPLPPPVACPSADPPTQQACAALAPQLATAPSLYEAYLARRHEHLTRRLPVAFPPTAEAPPPLGSAWSALRTDDDRRLVADIVRDATDRDTEWVMRDPIVGTGRVRLENKSLDDEAVRAGMDGWAPTLRALPDRTEATLEDLVAQQVVRVEGERHALFDAPEADHVVDEAVRDVRRYDQLRAGAYRAALERARAEVVSRDLALATAQAEASGMRWRLAGIAGLVWGLVLADLAASVAVTVRGLRRRAVAVTFDGHGLRIGGAHLAWDDLVDLTWYEDRVRWTTQAGDGEIDGLVLTPSEAKALHRACWTLRKRRGGPASGEEAFAALQQLVGQVSRPGA
ncbi:MAG: hypothetical protein R3F59_29560 [Myxococcota bacterium]